MTILFLHSFEFFIALLFEIHQDVHQFATLVADDKFEMAAIDFDDIQEIYLLLLFEPKSVTYY